MKGALGLLGPVAGRVMGDVGIVLLGVNAAVGDDVVQPTCAPVRAKIQLQIQLHEAQYCRLRCRVTLTVSA